MLKGRRSGSRGHVSAEGLKLLYSHLLPHHSITETFHTTILVVFVYVTSVSNFGNLLALNDFHWTGKWGHAFANLTIGIVQVLYSVKVHSPHTYELPGILCLARTMHFSPVGCHSTFLARFCGPTCNFNRNQYSSRTRRACHFVVRQIQMAGHGSTGNWSCSRRPQYRCFVFLPVEEQDESLQKVRLLRVQGLSELYVLNAYSQDPRDSGYSHPVGDRYAISSIRISRLTTRPLCPHDRDGNDHSVSLEYVYSEKLYLNIVPCP